MISHCSRSLPCLDTCPDTFVAWFSCREVGGGEVDADNCATESERFTGVEADSTYRIVLPPHFVGLLPFHLTLWSDEAFVLQAQVSGMYLGTARDVEFLGCNRCVGYFISLEGYVPWPSTHATSSVSIFPILRATKFPRFKYEVTNSGSKNSNKETLATHELEA